MFVCSELSRQNHLLSTLTTVAVAIPSNPDIESIVFHISLFQFAGLAAKEFVIVFKHFLLMLKLLAPCAFAVCLKLRFFAHGRFLAGG